jgi:hypothetical protein
MSLTPLLNSYRSEGGFRGGGGGGSGGGGRGKPPGIRLVVTGVSRDTSWQVRFGSSFSVWAGYLFHRGGLHISSRCSGRT